MTDRRRGGDAGPVAEVLLVFGCGLDLADGRRSLAPMGRARVAAAVTYVETHADWFAGRDGARVIFSGGWSHAGAVPPVGSREGDLMLRAAVSAGLDRRVALYTETRSRTTVENLFHARGDGLLGDCAFTDRRPLGLVTHEWHLPRARYLAARMLGVSRSALRGIPAAGGERRGDRMRERAIHAGSRLYFFGAGDPADWERRQRRVIDAVRRA